MIEFDTFCYLQNHKTGCTFVEMFLRIHAAEPVRLFHKHAALQAAKPDKFYFVNVRDPGEVYLSLYNYGLDGRGQVFERLRDAGQGNLYRSGIEGYEAWLAFVLDADNGPILAPGFTRAVAARVGLVSYRFLRLACPGFGIACARFSGADDVRGYFAREKIVAAVIRHERMAEELGRLVAGPLKHAINDVAAARAWIYATPPINPSNRRDQKAAVVIAPATREMMRTREWFLYENFYSDTNGSANGQRN